jgi:Protein of unknown function (DUF3313)
MTHPQLSLYGMKRFACIAIAWGVVAAFAGCAIHLPEEPANDDGLVLVEKSLLDELYVAPGAPLAHYQRVMIDPIEITFKEDWRKNHPDLSDKDFEALRTRLTTMLQEILVEEFGRGGYTLAEAPATDVLRVRASLVDVDLTSPETNLDKHTLARSDGEMTLRVEAFDAPSGALVARARDYEKDPESQRFERVDRISTSVAARRIFEKWAEALRSALDVAHVSANARQLQN